MAVVAYGALRLLVVLRVVVLPLLAAVIFTALLRPLRLRLEAVGLRRLTSTWLSFGIAFVVVLGVGTLVVYRTTLEWHRLLTELTATVHKVRHYLEGRPFHIKANVLDNIGTAFSHLVSQHRGAVVSGVLTGATLAAEVAGAAILTAFITFFLLYDGERIWRWATVPLGVVEDGRFDRAANAAWRTLSGYIRGSLVVAAIHGTVIAITLLILGVPLVLPLAVLVFAFSFIPLIGVLISGGLAVFVAAGTKGLAAGIVVLVVLVVEHQVEGHLLQPFIMGRYVRLHPLAIVLVLAIGTVLGGIVGALLAVPVAAVVHAAWPHLAGHPPSAESP